MSCSFSFYVLTFGSLYQRRIYIGNFSDFQKTGIVNKISTVETTSIVFTWVLLPGLLTTRIPELVEFPLYLYKFKIQKEIL